MKKKKKLIFVVDDDPVIRTSIADFLKFKGFMVREMDDGTDVLFMCQHFLPDLVISDIRMPKLDGISLIKGLKNRKDTRDIPVIFMSAYSDEDVMQNARKSGAKEFLLKPFPVSDIEEAVKKFLVDEYVYEVED